MNVSDEIKSTLQIDGVLSPYVEARDEADAVAELEQLICERAQPIVRQIVGTKLRVGRSANSDLTEDEANDLTSEITLKLVKRLDRLRENAGEETITNFRGYVAVTAYRACDEQLRKKYPRRHSLKNQLRYVLTHHEGFAIWEGPGGISLCGFKRWQDRKDVAKQSKLRRFVETLRLNDHSLPKSGQKLNPSDLLVAIFERLGEPLEFDDLVSAVAELWQVKDSLSRSNSADPDMLTGSAQAELSNRLETQMDQHLHLEKLWAEIRELPLRQRMALLLGLRDSQGCGMLALLPLIRIASIRQIAETLSMPAEKLATLWNQLPLEDNEIAEALGLTRQQVINLRKCARQRLWRRAHKSFGQM